MDEIHLDGQSKDIVAENISKLKEIFPEIYADGYIDFDKLKANLGEYVDDSNEKYNFTWSGKTQAIKESQKQSSGTLRPYKEESKNWDTTKNLYIEGDNLEVLKLLQKGYYNRIKCIYIDPPYNTGNDFIYPDNYQDNLENYLKISGQISEPEGSSRSITLTTNPETHGRFHTNWLNMIYPRLKLARNLLTDDGVIFISIDENELNNLKQLSDEIFGEENFVNLVSAKVKNIAGASGGGEDKKLKKNIEYILVYVKNYNVFNSFNSIYENVEIEELLSHYKSNNISWKYTSVLVDAGEKKYIGSTYDGDGDEIKIYKRLNPIFASINEIQNKDGISVSESYLKYFDKIFTTAMPQSSIRKRVLEKVKSIGELDSNGLYSIEYIPKSGRNKNKLYEQFYKGEKLRLFSWFRDVAEVKNNMVYKKNKLGTLWEGINLNNLSKEGDVVFKNGKKPLDLMSKVIDMVKLEDRDIILDFFSGSASTAHAVMDLNSNANKQYRFIMVQIPEIIDKKSENYGVYENICELGKERIRRAGDKIIEETNNKNLDIGFKVFKLDSSNLEKWDPDYNNIKESLLVDNIKPDRNKEDLIYELMLKYGLDLTFPIEPKGNNIYSIGYGALIVCLEDSITNENTKEITNQIIEIAKKSSISRAVFKDSSFNNKDSVKTNVKEILSNHKIDKFITI